MKKTHKLLFVVAQFFLALASQDNKQDVNSALSVVSDKPGVQNIIADYLNPDNSSANTKPSNTSVIEIFEQNFKIKASAYSPDGLYFAVAGADSSKTSAIKIYDVRKNYAYVNSIYVDGLIEALAYSGNYFVLVKAGSLFKELCFLDIANQSIIVSEQITLQTGESWESFVVLLEASSIIFAMTDGSMREWDSGTLTPKQSVQRPSGTTLARLSPAGNYIATCDKNKVYIWKHGTNKLITEISSRDTISNVLFSKDEKTISYIAGNTVFITPIPVHAQVQKRELKNYVFDHDPTAQVHNGSVSSALPQLTPAQDVQLPAFSNNQFLPYSTIIQAASLESPKHKPSNSQAIGSQVTGNQTTGGKRVTTSSGSAGSQAVPSKSLTANGLENFIDKNLVVVVDDAYRRACQSTLR